MRDKPFPSLSTSGSNSSSRSIFPIHSPPRVFIPSISSSSHVHQTAGWTQGFASVTVARASSGGPAEHTGTRNNSQKQQTERRCGCLHWTSTRHTPGPASVASLPSWWLRERYRGVKCNSGSVGCSILRPASEANCRRRLRRNHWALAELAFLGLSSSVGFRHSLLCVSARLVRRVAVYQWLLLLLVATMV